MSITCRPDRCEPLVLKCNRVRDDLVFVGCKKRGIGRWKNLKAVVPFMVDGGLSVNMFDDVDGGAVAVVNLFVAEGTYMMDEVPRLTLKAGPPFGTGTAGADGAKVGGLNLNPRGGYKAL